MNKTIKNVGLDKKIFKNTAKKTKRVNLSSRGFRGGIRL